MDPPETLTVSRQEVHVWRLPLNKEEIELRLLEQTLAPDERARAQRFHFERDRRRFVAARGQLRITLSRYVGMDPRSLMFSYGSNGKPSLAQPNQVGAIEFNLSHSGELALVAVTLSRRVGVDVERIHDMKDAQVIAERFFSPRESAALKAVPAVNRLEAFFHCWTLKEAYLKATGDGLARSTQSFDVTFARGQAPCLAMIEGEPQEAGRWSLVRVVPEQGYVGAIAVEGHGWALSCWQPRGLL